MIIEVSNLTFGYSGNPLLFDGFNFNLKEREAWSLIGPSGCGKTTLLYLLAGLLKPVHGSIFVAGSEIRRPRPRTGLILQDHGLLPWATIWENSILGWNIRRFYGPDGRHAPIDSVPDQSETESEVEYWLKRLGIAHLSQSFPLQLSRGQRQRAAIARTMALKPDLLLMDEPFSALDVGTSEDLHNIIAQLQEESVLTSILVTHDIEEAVLMGKKILVLSAKTNHEPFLIENDYIWREDYRNQEAFKTQADKLRGLLKELM